MSNYNKTLMDENQLAMGPECKPLVNLEELLHWCDYVTPSSTISLQPRTKFCVSGKTFRCHSGKNTMELENLLTEDLPRTLVCHDMRGGYIEDRFINGTTTDGAYRFFHWSGIDIFVYFSHHLLTIPPPGWITAGHIHGVKVLGTFITEWDIGEITWENILSSDETRLLCIERMVDICEKFAFDGYLLNVENKLNQERVSQMQIFIRDLHEALHKKLPNSELIWYDSLTTDGSLKWQNELNDNNKPFFDLCDGILLNYPWKEDHLERSAKNAGCRLRDVYAGIDVFGRGSFGGGGFGSPIALAEARRHGLSAALFAPGWTHEILQGEHFACTEYSFWAQLYPYLYLRGPASFPLVTSFCQGFGHRGRAQWGMSPSATNASSWYNLASQHMQPSVPSCLDSCCWPKSILPNCDASEAPLVTTATPAPDCGGENRGCVQHFEEDAFHGGGCLQIRRISFKEDVTCLHRLFVCDLVSSTGLLHIVYATKSACNDDTKKLRLGLVVRVDVLSTPRIILVDDHPGHLVKRSTCGKRWISVDSKDSNESRWKVWKHSIPFPRGDHVHEVLVALPSGCNSALLGWLEITDETEM